MVDRLEMAKQYVQEMLEKRDDIVGAFVAGSVARGEADETSDIDILVIVEGREGEEPQRGGIDSWRDGVYIEAALVPRDLYDDSEKVLTSYFEVTQMNEASILYDPTGRFTQVQDEVRAAYNEPRWLRVRICTAMQMLRDCLSSFQEAVSTADITAVCDYEPWVSQSLAVVPLVRCGITPSSTKSLLQLESVAPEWGDRVREWDGATRLRQQDVPALLDAVAEGLHLGPSAYASRDGEMYFYFAKKAQFLASEGHPGAAIHLMWYTVGTLARIVDQDEDEAIKARATRLLQTWLHAVGWEGQEVLAEKVRMAEEMVAEVEAMAAHLPLDEG